MVVPDLTPVKALKLRTSLSTGQCSKRAPWAAASVALAGEPSHTTITVARPQQERVMVVTSRALVPRDPHQGRGGSLEESVHQGLRCDRGPCWW
jgi:hypothetical protein